MASKLKLKSVFTCTVRLCHSNGTMASRRKYISRMYLYPPTKMKEEPAQCRSNDLFLHNEILYPCHKGSFYYLPLGLRSLEKLTRLIDEEMQGIGAQKIAMPTVISAAHWKKTGRWDTNELFKLKDRHSKQFCLGPTHEEPVTNLIAQYANLSHKRLPIMLYQITRKFRDEMQPKHGLLRGREFEMKDLYTFDTNEETARQTYNLVCDTYCRIFNRLQLNFHKVAGHTGNIGGKLSHEYHLPADIGEDTLYLCDTCGEGSNSELVAEDKPECDVLCDKCQSLMKKQTGIEVGHAFLLGTKYSSVFNATYSTQDRKEGQLLTEMGCYGLGVSRILQASVEQLQDNNRIRWPSVIAPYQICIIPQMKGYGSETFNTVSDSLSDTLCEIPNLRNEVVIDDRTDVTVGKRIHQADGQGYPYIVVIGRKCLDEPKLYEVVETAHGTKDFLTLEQLVDKFSMLQTI